MASEPNSKPRQLALIITELEVGGAERCLTNLVLGLDRRVFAPAVYSLWHRPAADRAEFVTKLEAADVPVHFVGLRKTWQLYQGLRRLRLLLARQRPELIQTFLFHANVLGTFLGRRLHVRRIVQGIRVADRSTWRMITERTAARSADAIVCVSESVANFASAEMGISRTKLRVIPNGIDVGASRDMSPADLRELGVLPGRRAIVVVGRLHRQKGIDWLLQVVPRLLATVPDVDIVLVGKGPEHDRLVQQARSVGIADRVHFCGWRPDVPAILRSASLLMLPSRWEGMPNAVLEAMAAGLPVVATRAEGVTELLGPLAPHQIVEFADDEALLAKSASILRDASLAQQLGQENQSRATAEFSLQAMIARYQQMYKELLDVC